MIELAKYVPKLENIFSDKQSGKDFDRPGYKMLKEKVREGDELYVILFLKKKSKPVFPTNQMRSSHTILTNNFINLEPVSEMRPVVVNPTENFSSLLEKLKISDDDKQIQKQINQIIGKLQRTKNKFRGETLEQFKNLADGKTPEQITSEVKKLSPQVAKNFLFRHVDLFGLLQQKNLNSGRPFVISEHEDELTEHSRGYGEGKKPQDYLEEFADFLKANQNKIDALNIIMLHEI